MHILALAGVMLMPGHVSALEAEVKKGRKWDAVIDNTASIPRWVEESAGLLKDSAELYLYTSSISAYGSITVPGTDETTPVATMDPAEVPLVVTTKDIVPVVKFDNAVIGNGNPGPQTAALIAEFRKFTI